MVRERYTGFQLHRVNDSDGLNADDIDYAFAANGSSVSLYMILNGLYKPLYFVSFNFRAQSLIFCLVNITQFSFLALSNMIHMANYCFLLTNVLVNVIGPFLAYLIIKPIFTYLFQIVFIFVIKYFLNMQRKSQ